jgi:hypothetical protein
MEIGERKLRATAARAPQTVGTKASYINAARAQRRHGGQAQLCAGAFFAAQTIQIPLVMYMGSTFVSYIYGNVKGWCV